MYDGSACSGVGIATIEFAYHMRGATVGRLDLTTAEGSTLWSAAGSQGDGWRRATVSGGGGRAVTFVATHVDDRFTRAAAAEDWSWPNFEGDIAVDDIVVA